MTEDGEATSTHDAPVPAGGKVHEEEDMVDDLVYQMYLRNHEVHEEEVRTTHCSLPTIIISRFLFNTGTAKYCN